MAKATAFSKFNTWDELVTAVVAGQVKITDGAQLWQFVNRANTLHWEIDHPSKRTQIAQALATAKNTAAELAEAKRKLAEMEKRIAQSATPAPKK